MRLAPLALVALTACGVDFECCGGEAWASRREPDRSRRPHSPRRSEAVDVDIRNEQDGLAHSLIFAGLEQSSGSVSPWSNYPAFPALAYCGSSEWLSVARRSPIHGVDFNEAKLVQNRSINDGHSWVYSRLDEPEVEDNSALNNEDPYTPALMVRASDGLLLLTYEVDFNTGGSPMSRLVYYRTSADCGGTWSARTLMPNPGTLYSSAGGHCIELPWGTGACPGTGCAILCPYYFRNVGENRYTSVAYMFPGGLGTAPQRRGTIAVDADPGGLQYEEPTVELLTGDGACGTGTSTSCVMALVRDDLTDQGDGAGTIWKTYSRNGGMTWDALTVAFAGVGLPDMAEDPVTGTIVAVTRGVPRDSCPTCGQTNGYVSVDRGVTWSGPTELAHTQIPSATTYGANSSYLYAQLVDRGDDRFAMAYGQEGDSAVWGDHTMWAFQDLVVGREPAAGEMPFKSSRSWYQLLASAVYATGGAVAALHGATRLSCGWWYRGDTNTQTETILRYGGAADNLNQGFYIERSNTNQHFEVSIAATTGGFQRIIAANATNITDMWESYFFTYDGAGTTNAERLQLARQGADISGGATYSGTIPATMTTPATAVLRMGHGSTAGSNYVRTSLVDHIACWIGANAPTRAQFAAAASAWHNDGAPDLPATVAAAWSGATANIYFPLDGSTANAGSTSVGTITETGTFLYTNERIVGPGYAAP